MVQARDVHGIAGVGPSRADVGGDWACKPPSPEAYLQFPMPHPHKESSPSDWPHQPDKFLSLATTRQDQIAQGPAGLRFLAFAAAGTWP